MDERIAKWLFDIRAAIAEINSFIPPGKRDFNAYRTNVMLKRAVERELEIIGEALNRILKRDNEFEAKIPDSRRIVGLRNQVIHAYDSLSDELIWSVLINHLPELERSVTDLLDGGGGVK